MKILAYGLSLALAFFSTETLAKPPANKGGKPDKAQNEKQELREDLRDIEDGLDLVSSLISSSDARALAKGAGATGYKPLPPGIRKNLARGKPIPPGIQKSRMPDGMLGKLPKQAGYEWRNAGTDLLLVQAGTEIVADVLKDVFK
jgi:hypothetical protein